MKKRLILFMTAISALACLAFYLPAGNLSGKSLPVRTEPALPVSGQVTPPLRFVIDTVATNLYFPWDIVFLPDSSMLFTERPGRVRLYRKNKLLERPVLLIGDVEVKGKMGLLGMRLHPHYTVNHLVYLAYNYRVQDQTFLRIVRYTMERDSLIHPQTIIETIPGVFNHTGCRLVFGKDDKSFITTGDADVPILAQDLKALNGKILRLFV